MILPFRPENEVIIKDKYKVYMNKKKLRKYTEAKNLVCDWIYKKLFISLEDVEFLC